MDPNMERLIPQQLSAFVLLNILQYLSCRFFRAVIISTRQKSTPCLWYPQIVYFNSSEMFGSDSMRVQSTELYKFISAGDHNALHCWSYFMLYSQRAQHCPHPYLKEKKLNTKRRRKTPKQKTKITTKKSIYFNIKIPEQNTIFQIISIQEIILENSTILAAVHMQLWFTLQCILGQ